MAQDPNAGVPSYETATGQHQGSPPPGQPMVQHDVYQSPAVVSPQQTGQIYASSPVQSPPIASEKQDYYAASQPQGQHPAQQQPPQQQFQQQQHPSQGQVPQQQNFAPQQVQHSNTYQNAYPLGNLQDQPMPVDCPMCRQRSMTRTEFHAGNTTHAWAAAICACFCLGCIPYLISSLKDVDHKCGNCGALLATFKRSGRTVVVAHA